jgi:uroporphyrinogen decarboxylase
MGRYDLHLPGEEGQSHRERYLAVKRRLGDTLLLPSESPVGLQEAVYRAGLELFVYAHAEDPGLISDWLEAFCEAEVKRIHDVADPTLFPVTLVYNDLAHRTGTIFSPVFLRKEFIPRLRRVVEAWHSHNIRVIFHSDGNLWGILDDLVATGIDGLNPIETIAGMGLGEIRRRFPHLVLMGGVDASRLLPYGTPQQVVAEVLRALEATGGRGYILGSTTEIHNECRPENVLAMWSAAVGYQP